MAFLWKHPQSRNWYARFTDIHGCRRNRSTGTSNRKEALKIAESFEAAARQLRTAKQVRKVIAELHQEITGEELVCQSFEVFSSAWIQKKKGEVSAATLAFYQKTISKFSEFLGPRKQEDIARVTRADLLKFRTQLSGSISAKTTNHNIKGLRMLFKAAKQEQLIAENPTEGVDTLKVNRENHRRPFTLEEVRALLAHSNAEWQSMIRFALYTGQRLADIASLKWENVDLKQKEIRLRTRKTGKALVLPIAQPLLNDLTPRSKGTQPHQTIHPKAFEIVSKKGSTGHLSNQFAKIMALAGLRATPTHQKKRDGQGRSGARSTERLSFHCFRHTAVTLLKEAGIPQAVVMELVGHDSEQMSAVYTHVGREAMEKAANAFPEL